MVDQVLGTFGSSSFRNSGDRRGLSKDRHDGKSDPSSGSKFAKSPANGEDAVSFRRANEIFKGTLDPSGRITARTINEGEMTQQDVYGGPERRHIPYKMQVEPSSGWWSKVTMPFVLALLVQAGGVIWWASKVSSEIDGLRSQLGRMNEDLQQSQEYSMDRHAGIMTVIRDTRLEIRENRSLIFEQLREAANGDN